MGLAIADWKIAGVNSPVSQYLPQLKGSGYEGVPIRDLLEMSSGVNFTEAHSDPSSGVEIMGR